MVDCLFEHLLSVHIQCVAIVNKTAFKMQRVDFSEEKDAVILQLGHVSSM